MKQAVLKSYAKRYGIRILVETGTYRGDMIAAMKGYFECIFSIELSHELYHKARKRFSDDNNVILIQGDSADEIKIVLSKISHPALFWLDGHYSGGETARGEKDTPIYEELYHILTSTNYNHIIIIDDARCFGTDPAYPTLEEITGFVKSKKPNSIITVKDDTIRISPSDWHFSNSMSMHNRCF